MSITKRYAMIKNGIVENIVLWDGETTWNPGNYQLVDVSGISCSIGMTYNDGIFSEPEAEQAL